MKKTITILSALAMTCSPALALNVVNHKTQNLQYSILKATTNTKVKPNNVVNNDIVVQSVQRHQFYFQARLSNSTYNGFPAFMNQIVIHSPLTQQAWGIFFFQWLDDNDFNGNFPDLGDHTKQGFWHEPMVWANRLETHMGHFGSLFDSKTGTAWNMIGTGVFWPTFGQNVENTYNKDAATGNVAGIELNFGFTYTSTYHAVEPNFVITMN